jgi:hypothetical protein
MFVQTDISKISNSLHLDLYIPQLNEGKSAASFCHQVAVAWFPDMFCNFYFVKNHKIDKNSTTTKATEK